MNYKCEKCKTTWQDTNFCPNCTTKTEREYNRQWNRVYIALLQAHPHDHYTKIAEAADHVVKAMKPE